MYPARHPMHASALMHGCTPVSAGQFNHSYNDSNNNPNFSSFTTRQSHPATALSAALGQSHGFVHNNDRLHPPFSHIGQCYGQSDARSATPQMSGNHYSRLTVPDANLNGSLLCSPWPPLPLSGPSTQPTTRTLPAPINIPYHAQIQSLELSEPDLTLPPLEQVHSSSSASLNDPTPGLTPTSSVGSTPATSVGVGEDDNLAKVLDRGSQQCLEGLRRIQPKPPELSTTASVDHTLADIAPQGTLLPEPPADASNILEELPEWPQSADFQGYVYSQFPQNQATEFPMPSSVDDRLHTVDPTVLNVFDNFIHADAFADLGNGLSSAYPDLPNDFDPFTVLANDNPMFTGGQASSDVCMPLLSFDDDAMATRAFDDRPYTGMLGADHMGSLTGLALHAAPTTDGTLHGEGSRRDTARDNELLDLRAQGLSYKDIKQRFGFNVAESTLRGRMRSLMKKKEDRVRKPSWKPDNVRLLCSCVMEYAIHRNLPSDVVSSDGLPLLRSEHSINKVSWKRVAKAMADQGSYHYGNATVKKKYMDLRKEQMTRRS